MPDQEVEASSLHPTSSALSTTRRWNAFPEYLGESIYNFKAPHLAQIDADLLTHTVRDAGLHAFGVIFLEVWVVSSDGTQLIRPTGGHWMDPVFIQGGAPDNAEEVENTAPNCVPGESLAGTLFNETMNTWGWFRIGRRSVHWRQLKSMIEDPYLQTSSDTRTRQLYDLGIGIVGTVPFSYQERTGIVLFMSRATANIDLLRADENESYLIAATDLIGAAFAIRIPRIERSRKKRERFQAAVRKVVKQARSQTTTFASLVMQAAELHKMNLPAVPTSAASASQHGVPFGSTKEEWDTEQPSSSESKIHESWKEDGTCLQRAMYSMKRWFISTGHHLEISVRKWKGQGLHAAPRQNVWDSTIAFTGCFCVMLVLLQTNHGLKQRASTWWTFEPSWYASTLCIVFGLTSAPVGQPRQIILAHLWNALVGLAVQHIPTFDQEIYWFVLKTHLCQSLGLAIGVAGQAYLGIIHPPASALSYAFATNPKWGASNILMIMLADLILIGMSVVILNLTKTRQYPMFWVGNDWKNSTGREHQAKWFGGRKRNMQEMGQSSRDASSMGSGRSINSP